MAISFLSLCHRWRQGSSVAPAQNRLWKVAKALLLLSHGQARVEGGFSVNSNVSTTNMQEDTLVARRMVKDLIYHMGGLKDMSIPNKMVTEVWAARHRYDNASKLAEIQSGETEARKRRKKRRMSLQRSE